MNKAESKYFNTAERMNNALISILGTKPFEYITVKEICTAASVNRSTFYLHYENTRDLLDETARRLLDRFLSYFSADAAAITLGFSDCALSDLNFITEKYLFPYLSYIKDNRTVFATALAHRDSFGFEDIYRKLFTHIFNPILGRFHYPEGDRKFVMLFYLNGLTAIVEEWLREGCDRSVEELSEIIRVCVFGRAQETSFSAPKNE